MIEMYEGRDAGGERILYIENVSDDAKERLPNICCSVNLSCEDEVAGYFTHGEELHFDVGNNPGIIRCGEYTDKIIKAITILNQSLEPRLSSAVRVLGGPDFAFFGVFWVNGSILYGYILKSERGMIEYQASNEMRMCSLSYPVITSTCLFVHGTDERLDKELIVSKHKNQYEANELLTRMEYLVNDYISSEINKSKTKEQIVLTKIT